MGPSILSVLARSCCVGIVENGHWKPGIGDPTVGGWATVFAYVAATLLCVWATVKSPRGLAPLDASKHHMFWGGLSLVMLLLAVNKQLDLQLWFWLTGRNMIQANGWGEYRRILQVGWIMAIALVGGMGLAYFGWLTHNQSRQRMIALAGVVFTVGFVLIRAGSLHHVDTVLGWHVAGVRMNWILENSGILLVAIGAIAAIRCSRRAPDVAQ